MPNKQYDIRPFYGNVHVLELRGGISIFFNKVDIQEDTSLFLYRKEGLEMFPSSIAQIYVPKNKKLVDDIVSYCDRNLVEIQKIRRYKRIC